MQKCGKWSFERWQEKWSECSWKHSEKVIIKRVHDRMKIAGWMKKSFKTKEKNKNLQKAWLTLLSKWFWMQENSHLYELQTILIYWGFCIQVYCTFFIVLFCKLTFITLASHVNNFPVSAIYWIK